MLLKNIFQLILSSFYLLYRRISMFRKKALNYPTNIQYLIVGIGNPDPTYCGTRHNVGKMIVTEITKELKVKMSHESGGTIGFYQRENRPTVAFFITQCFMNLSGYPVKSVYNACNINDISRLIVVHDDLDSKIGKVKIKEGGSPEGHNGLKSIIRAFSLQEFIRIKIGIDRPTSKDHFIVSNYVTSQFTIGFEISNLDIQINYKIQEKHLSLQQWNNYINWIFFHDFIMQRQIITKKTIYYRVILSGSFIINFIY